jgi:hypothetical protein
LKECAVLISPATSSTVSSHHDIAGLSVAGQFFIWAARQWVYVLNPRNPCTLQLGAAFSRMGVRSSLCHLDLLLGNLALHARQQLDFKTPNDARLGHDEYQMLMALSDAQASRHARAHLICEQWVATAHAIVIFHHISKIAHIFLSAGLDFSSLRLTSKSLH